MLHEPKKNLQRVIQKFLVQAVKTVDLTKRDPSLLSKQELDKLAERIWELRHYAVELLEHQPEESTWYNASIIQQIVEQPITIPGSFKTVTLIKAADETKKANNDTLLRHVVSCWMAEDALRQVLFSNLQEISEELTAS
ncbi:MAG: hypothetical protein JSR76_04930 [Verrucomicrobia bacterium]|nr:hypothetical protein [Verrucomicrobiota bacterium]